MPRILAFIYGLICYVTFFFTFLYAIGFVENLYVPKAIDAPPTASLGQALLIDAILLGVFALQHSVMARQRFKETWTKIVPKPVERSTYVLFASLALLLLFWKWEPIGGVVWEVRSQPARLGLQSLSLVGWLIVLVSTFLINHFELFGLRQVFSYLRGVPDAPPEFKTPAFYNYVRHPIYFGFVIAFWATPTMSIAHFVFAAATTGYMLIAIQLEERDLVRFFGSQYEAYKGQVSMLIPRRPKRGSQPSAPGSRLGST